MISQHVKRAEASLTHVRKEENAAGSLFPGHSCPGREEKAHGTWQRVGGSDRYTACLVLGWSQDAACFSDSQYPRLVKWEQNWEAGDTTQMCRSHEVMVRMDQLGRTKKNGGSPASLPHAGQSPASGSHLGRTSLYCPKPSHDWSRDWNLGIKAAQQSSLEHTRS